MIDEHGETDTYQEKAGISREEMGVVDVQGTPSWGTDAKEMNQREMAIQESSVDEKPEAEVGNGTQTQLRITVTARLQWP